MRPRWTTDDNSTEDLIYFPDTPSACSMHKEEIITRSICKYRTSEKAGKAEHLGHCCLLCDLVQLLP